MNDTNTKFLRLMLEGYEGNLKQMDQYIDQNAEQLESARASRDEVVSNIQELKELLGVTDEEDSVEAAAAE